MTSRVFRVFLGRIISVTGAKKAAMCPNENGTKKKTRDIEIVWALSYIILCWAANHHVSFAQIINSLFHNYHNAFAKMPMPRLQNLLSDSVAPLEISWDGIVYIYITLLTYLFFYYKNVVQNDYLDFCISRA